MQPCMLTPALPIVSNEIGGGASVTSAVSVIMAAVHRLGSPGSSRHVSLPLSVAPIPFRLRLQGAVSVPSLP